MLRNDLCGFSNATRICFLKCQTVLPYHGGRYAFPTRHCYTDVCLSFQFSKQHRIAGSSYWIVNLQVYPNQDATCLDLLDNLLKFSPDKRLSATEALAHPYFEELHDPEDEHDCKVFAHQSSHAFSSP